MHVHPKMKRCKRNCYNIKMILCLLKIHYHSMNVNSLLRKSQFNFHSKATANTDVHILGLGRQIKMKYTT